MENSRYQQLIKNDRHYRNSQRELLHERFHELKDQLAQRYDIQTENELRSTRTKLQMIIRTTEIERLNAEIIRLTEELRRANRLGNRKLAEKLAEDIAFAEEQLDIETNPP